MKTPKEDIEIGCYYVTSTDQLRKVVEIKPDSKGRSRVIYLVKSMKIENKAFGHQGTKYNPILLDNFAKFCLRKLTKQEVDDLRKKGILLAGE